MTILQSIILGIIQGLTEFLPISSSAHLVLTPYLLGWDIPDQAAFIFDVLVQLGTLVAVITYFWKDLITIVRAFLQGIWQKKPFADFQSRLGWYLIVASIPAVLAGVLFNDLVEQAFSSPLASALFLLITAILLFTAEKYSQKKRGLTQLTWIDALVIGLFQSISLLPGISRSGSTISAGMLRNLDRRSAARFSFLMSIPVMIGAGGLAMIDLFQLPDFTSQLPALMYGFMAAAIVGYLSIHWLLRYLTQRSLYLFAGYCLVFSFITILIISVRG